MNDDITVLAQRVTELFRSSYVANEEVNKIQVAFQEARVKANKTAVQLEEAKDKLFAALTNDAEVKS